MTHIATVSPTELIRTTWGNSVAAEFNTKCVKSDGTIGDGLAPTNQWMTGSLTINAGPALKLRRSDNTPFFQFESTTGTRFGFLQGLSAQLKYNVDSATGIHTMEVAAAEKLRVDNAGVDVTGALTVTGTSSLTGLVQIPGGLRVGGNGAQIWLIDTSTSGTDFHDCYMAFYGGGVSMVSPGTRTGYVGFPGTDDLTIKNEVSGGGIGVGLTGGGNISLAATTGTIGLATTTGAIGLATTTGPITLTTTGGTGNIHINSRGEVLFSSGGGYQGKISTYAFEWGKSASDGAVAGIELHGTGSGATGRLLSTTDTATNLYLRHIGTNDADAKAFVQFLNGAGGVLSEIQQDAVAPPGIKIINCAVTAPSDYRLKNDLGPVVGALDRVMQLQPKHLSWKETGAEFDGFIAHEVANVVPVAVFGEKDAVYDAEEAERMGVEPGSIKPQQFGPEPLIPLLTAGLQELVGRVAALEGAA